MDFLFWLELEPAANFPMRKGYCDYDQHFDAHKMVFDLTFCVSAFRVFCL